MPAHVELVKHTFNKLALLTKDSDIFFSDTVILEIIVFLKLMESSHKESMLIYWYILNLMIIWIMFVNVSHRVARLETM